VDIKYSSVVVAVSRPLVVYSLIPKYRLVDDAVVGINGLNLKIKLESQLEKSMRAFFKTIAKDANVYYKNNQQIMDLRKYDPELNIILRQHYRKTAKQFENRLRVELQKRFNITETKAADDKISQRLNDYFYRRSIEQTHFISETNSSELFSSFQTTMLDAAMAGTLISKNDLADQATEHFLSRTLGRAKTIGMTETQNAAEKTKDIEATSIFDDEEVVAGGVRLSPDNIVKTWSAILDDRTRMAHVDADDQTVPQDEPFIVDGEKLMFPGDDSMGASLENIINCRCNTTRAIELSELPDYVEQPANDAPRRGHVHFP